ncbi:hypothetical protein [Halopelagius fulvigenes]|uniref:Twin-arginine translocation signal domain-containing protein n=1 Tax=Halopelagius fulvigenes TaxID=1198324 RepID=A0ABD5TWT9_9EURY
MSEEHRVDENEEGTDSINRRSFVRALSGAGGVAITGSVSPSTAQAAPPEQSPSKSREAIPVDELDQLARKVTEQEDVANIMDATMRETVQTGTVVEASHSSSASGGIITRNSPQVAKENSVDDLAKDDIFVSGVRHTLENGNEMTALAYATDNEAIWWREFSKVEGGIKTKATRWKIKGETVEDARLELSQLSANGKLTKPQSDFTTMSHCSGCSAISSGWLHHRKCTNYNVVCLSACSACGTVKSCLPCLIACVGTWCVWLLERCCRNFERTCIACQ